jgi:predicted NodU family carbamoyl transferase
MGLSCYGKPNDEIPSFIHKDNELKEVSDVVSNSILLNPNLYPQLKKYDKEYDPSFQQRADMAYRIQKDLEEKVICVVEKAMEMNDCKNIVLTGGVFHNVMINELLSSKYPDYNFFADPICDDAGHSFGGAIWSLKTLSGKDFNMRPKSMYLGPSYWKEEIRERVINAVDKYNCPVL